MPNWHRILQLIQAPPNWHRAQLARQTCQQLGWMDLRGRPKLMSARVALLRLHRAGWINLPQRKGRRLPEVEVNAVYLREVDAPKGQAPVEWLLLTRLPVTRFEPARQLALWYLCRWPIELFFKIIKSGCAVEDRQLETAQRWERCLALSLIMAWRVLFLVWLGRTEPEMSWAAVFSEAERKSVWRVVRGRAPPPRPPKLSEFTRILARRGGHLNRQHDGPVGIQRMWIALQRMRAFALAWEASRT